MFEDIRRAVDQLPKPLPDVVLYADCVRTVTDAVAAARIPIEIIGGVPHLLGIPIVISPYLETGTLRLMPRFIQVNIRVLPINER